MSTSPQTRKRRRSREDSDDIIPSKKPRIDANNDSNGDESPFESEEDTQNDESEYELTDESNSDSDIENNNTTNTASRRKTRSATKKRKNTSNTAKDARISELEDEVKDLKQENKKLKAQITKLKKSKNANASASPKKALNADKVKKKYFKKWSARFPKVAAMKKTKFKGYSSEISIEEMGFDREEFDILFDGSGFLVQPRPDNKPRSTVIVRRFDSWEKIKDLFGDYGLTQDINVSVWSSGRHFSKSRFSGQDSATIDSLEVHYNKSRKVLTLKFDCSREGCGGGWW